jgi:iron(III) transport system permease protein
MIFLIIVLGPIILMFFNSVIVNGEISFLKYQNIFIETRQIKLFLNSLLLGIGVSIFSLLLGVPLGIILSRTDIYLRRYLQHIYLLPLLIPPFISAIGWIELLPFSLYGLPASILVLGLSYFPFVTILTISGLLSVNRELEDAARLVYDDFTAIRKLTLPLIKPNILAGAIFVFIFTLSNYGVPSLLRLNTYPVEIFAEFSAFYDSQKATALAAPLVLVTLGLIFAVRYLMSGRSYVNLDSSSEEPKIFRLGKRKIWASMFVSLVIFISVILPIIMLLKRSQDLISYRLAFKTAGAQIVNSLILAIIAATIILFFSFFIGYFIERTKNKGRAILETISILPFAIPGSMVGISLICLWNRQYTQFIYASWFMIILGYMVRFLPFTITITSASVKKISFELEEAAQLTKIHWIWKTKQIILPLMRPGLIAAWIIAFVLSIGELETTLLIIPPGETTLPIRIFTLMHYGANKLVAALSVILIIITSVPLILVAILERRKLLLR